MYKQLPLYNRGFTASSFDLLHAGHVRMLQECKENCKELYVGFNCNPKGKNPIQTTTERYIQLSAVKYVDHIIPYSIEEDIIKILSICDIDARFVGSDYREKEFTGLQYCLDNNIDILYNDRSHGYSSTELKQRVYESFNNG